MFNTFLPFRNLSPSGVGGKQQGRGAEAVGGAHRPVGSSADVSALQGRRGPPSLLSTPSGSNFQFDELNWRVGLKNSSISSIKGIFGLSFLLFLILKSKLTLSKALMKRFFSRCFLSALSCCSPPFPLCCPPPPPHQIYLAPEPSQNNLLY